MVNALGWRVCGGFTMLSRDSMLVEGPQVLGPMSLPAADDSKVIANEFLTSYWDLTRSLGGDPALLLAGAGIALSSLHKPGGKVPLRAVANLLEISARVLGCPDFGMQLAERQNGASIMKPVDRLIRNAPTLGDANRYVTSQMKAYSSGICATLARDTERQMQFLGVELLLDGFVACPQIVEQIVLLIHTTTLALTGGGAHVREVWFSHPRVSRLVTYSKRFGVPVRFGQPLAGAFLTDADLNCKLVDRDPRIFAAESRWVAARFPDQPPGIGVQVRQAIMRTLAEENCTRGQVAASLGMHTRTLQRRLCGIGISFEALRDEVRRNLAARYLARRDLCLTDIVDRLGYSEPAVLSRSCRRWFAATPSELRRNLIR
jgi:AraC-like DNA-binding protein